FVSILIPMHNEEKVADQILLALIDQEYPKDKMEIIPINDHSTDSTQNILEKYAKSMGKHN
ncbi:glycosyltransferase, partial [Escherichia coli]|uniref:glycosyltransferase n=1 Tax=Escherichia coli TaxID=562 RepID=UPI00128EFCAA